MFFWLQFRVSTSCGFGTPSRRAILVYTLFNTTSLDRVLKYDHYGGNVRGCSFQQLVGYNKSKLNFASFFFFLSLCPVFSKSRRLCLTQCTSVAILTLSAIHEARFGG